VLGRKVTRLTGRLLARRGLELVPRGAPGPGAGAGSPGGHACPAGGPALSLPRGYFEERPFEDIIDYNGAAALRLLDEVFPLYADEYNAFPREPAGSGFYLKNEFFGPVDAEVLYCMVRHHRPREVVEVGSGYSSLVARMALDVNRPEPGRLTCIDPSPRADVASAADVQVLEPVERAGGRPFSGLGAGDILFVDSSHVVETGGDLNFIFFEVLPSLPPGVLIHFHDICLPRDYLYDWVVTEGRGYTEQYLLLAFLAGNSGYEVVWPGLYMMLTFPERVMEVFPSCNNVTAPVSFWMRKT